MLGTTCKALRAAVASSRWPPWPPGPPVILPDGSVGEPPSGRGHAVCSPSAGGEGIAAAVASVPPGGSVYLLPGTYVLAETLLLTRPVTIYCLCS